MRLKFYIQGQIHFKQLDVLSGFSSLPQLKELRAITDKIDLFHITTSIFSKLFKYDDPLMDH